MQPQNCILGESQKYYIDCKKSDTQKYILYDIIYKSLKSKVRNQSSSLPMRGRDWWSRGVQGGSVLRIGNILDQCVLIIWLAQKYMHLSKLIEFCT